MLPNTPRSENKNLFVALALASVVMLGWHFFYEAPRLKAAQEQQAKQEQTKKQAPNAAAKTSPEVSQQQAEIVAEQQAARVRIANNVLHGSLSLRGGRFDDITLANYRETLEKDSPEVTLLASEATAKRAEDPYFAEFGFLSNNAQAPTNQTVWRTRNDTLGPDSPAVLEWDNGAGLAFEKKIALDQHYMFSITLKVTNTSQQSAELFPYGLINRTTADENKHFYILHEGPIGVAGGELREPNYQELREEGAQSFEHTKGWAGITDKYWLAAIIPTAGSNVDMRYRHVMRAGRDAYQVDVRGEAMQVAPGETKEVTLRFYAGAKEVKLLDQYRDMLEISLFDRAVDFGMLYFITKPMFQFLSFLHGLVGNFGIAILLLTVCIKIPLFPLANKSYTAMSKMRLLTPRILEIRDKFPDDKMKQQREMIELYKREKVNPMSGCWPMLIQIPIFFALYKVLFVTIEMRHAPFFGWIHDLSAADPTSLFNLFGLLPYDVPSFLHIGIWPCIMCATMVLQQKLNPKPTDEIQAMMIAWMPYIFVFLFAGFPAGLVIYWAWNNTLSIIQQSIITYRLKRKGLHAK